MNEGRRDVHWFWTESLWLPVGHSWSDYDSTNSLVKADIRDLCYLPLFVAAISLIRYLFEWYIARPFCLFIGIKDDETRDQSSVKTIKNCLTKKQVNTSLRGDLKRSKPSIMRKSTETCWRSFAYYVMFIYGTFVLWNNEWFLDYSKWLPDYLKHPFTADVKIYYFLEMTFYFSLLFSQFTDTKRKDFMQQFVHHVTTLMLLLCSYILSLYRFGTIIMYIHDAADVWLEPAKLFNYAKKQKICDFLFVGFAIVFFATRLMYYPSRVAYGYFHYNENQNSLVFQAAVCLCFVLLFLNFYWGFLVLRLAYKLVTNKKAVVKDNRSDSEDSDED